VRIGTTGDGQNRDQDVYCVNSAKGHELAYGLREMDARLIAAAPELLKAGQELIDALLLEMVDSGGIVQVQNLKAAIRKATGSA
jgi:hypothetical protein